MTITLVPKKEETRMKMVRKLALGSLLAAALSWVALSASAQNQPGYVPGYPQPGAQNLLFSANNPYQSQSQSAQLAKQYVDAKEADKTEIRKHLLEALSQQFDQHIQEQQKELDDLEKKIAQLKAVLKKRIDAKSTIVERRAEQLIQDAAGLGWNTPSNPLTGNDQWYWGFNRPKGPAPKTETKPQVK
jgi:hypothetical protein